MRSQNLKTLTLLALLRLSSTIPTRLEATSMGWQSMYRRQMGKKELRITPVGPRPKIHWEMYVFMNIFVYSNIHVSHRYRPQQLRMTGAKMKTGIKPQQYLYTNK